MSPKIRRKKIVELADVRREGDNAVLIISVKNDKGIVEYTVNKVIPYAEYENMGEEDMRKYLRKVLKESEKMRYKIGFKVVVE